MRRQSGCKAPAGALPAPNAPLFRSTPPPRRPQPSESTDAGELADAEQLDPTVQRAADRAQRAQQKNDRSHLADAPSGPHLLLEAGDVAEVVELLHELDPELKFWCRRVDTALLPIAIAVACGVFLRCPVRIRAGMFDENGTNRDHPGNGWAHLIGAARARPAMTASAIIKAFNKSPELWIPDHQKVEAREGHLFTSFDVRADGSDYPRTGRLYPRFDARRITYIPADTWRMLAETAFVQRVVQLLYHARQRKRTRLFVILRAWTLAARNKRHSLRRRGFTFDQSIAWSRAERSEAKEFKIRLPPKRVAKTVQDVKNPADFVERREREAVSTPKKEPPHREGMGRKDAAEPRTSLGPAAPPPSRSRRCSDAPAASSARRPSPPDAGRGGRGTDPRGQNTPEEGRKRAQEARSTPEAARGTPGERLALLRERSKPARESLERMHDALELGPKPTRSAAGPRAPSMSAPVFRSTPPRRAAAPPVDVETPADTAVTFRATPPPRRTVDEAAPAVPELVHHLAAELGVSLEQVDQAERIAIEELEAERRWRRGKR